MSASVTAGAKPISAVARGADSGRIRRRFESLKEQGLKGCDESLPGLDMNSLNNVTDDSGTDSNATDNNATDNNDETASPKR